MAKNDFWAGVLQGLYQGGIGNPQVNEERRRNELNLQYQQAQLDMKAKENGMIPDSGSPTAPPAVSPNTPSVSQPPVSGGLNASTFGGPNVQPNAPAASPASPTAPQTTPAGTLHQDHPFRAKIGDFLKSVIMPGSTGPGLNTAYKADTSADKWWISSDGMVDFGKAIPKDATPISSEKGPSLMSAQERVKRGDTDFDTARSISKSSGMDSDTVEKMITNANKNGRTSLTKGEMDNLYRMAQSKRALEQGDYYKKQGKLFRDKFEFAKRQATYGGKFGANQLSLNTAVGHLGDAMTAMSDLGNTDINALNKPINEIGKLNNNGEIVAAGINMTALENEIATAFKGTGATDQEISQWRESLNTNLTPMQWMSAASKMGDLLNSRLESLGYQQGLQNPDVAGKNPLSPKAQKVMKDIKSNPLLKKKQDSNMPPGFSALSPAEQAEYLKLSQTQTGN